jgi:hypothetical protein
MQRTEGTEDANFYIGKCKLTDEEKEISYNNPHCLEYFCNIKNITNCTCCASYLTKQKKIKLFNDEYFKKKLEINDHKKEDMKYCQENCNNGYIYNYISRDDENKRNAFNIDNYKNMNNFKCNDFITKYTDLPYKIKYEKKLLAKEKGLSLKEYE